jgi:hypothetical protein
MTILKGESCKCIQIFQNPWQLQKKVLKCDDFFGKFSKTSLDHVAWEFFLIAKW